MIFNLLYQDLWPRVLQTRVSDEWKMDELMKVMKQEIESPELCYFVAKSMGKTDR